MQRVYTSLEVPGTLSVGFVRKCDDVKLNEPLASHLERSSWLA
jgi:hypothetical protein